MKKEKLFLLLTVLLVMPVLEAAGAPVCTTCSKSIRGRYIVDSRKRAFCSEKCFEETLPRCANCRKICKDGTLKVKNDFFCSRKCADEKILPRCSRCNNPCREFMILPTGYGVFSYCHDCFKTEKCLVCQRRTKKLYPQRNGCKLCQFCQRNTITDIAQLQRVFDDVRKTLTKHFNFPSDHPIKLEMRSFTAQEDNGDLFGLYKYNGKIVKKNKLFSRKKPPEIEFRDQHCTIVVADCLPRLKAAETIAHELAHDYMKHRWFFIGNDKLKEGFAEFIAAEYNRISGNKSWNVRMEKNPDKIYGDGYREINALYRKGSWQAIYQLFDRVNLQDTPAEYR